ncbi:MAG: hypothetical protein KH376_07770 [Holdemanella biformis]|uniref:hypothetical protein n=1 Tax=Holdemanella biformis TaxID=1735 RepID=UPI0024304994|nr:hypothetical protein [Holdemanella biformis]MBS6455623.1 hypothetical protein [Holdemanella biformis]
MDYSELKYDVEEFESDQDKKLPQPPLVKEAMRKESIELPKNFDALQICSNFLDIINTRHSSRVYTQEPMSLLELSYILWTCQGVKQIRGKNMRLCVQYLLEVLVMALNYILYVKM